MRRLFAFLLVLATACGGTQADQQNGEIISGQIVRIDGNAADIDSFVVAVDGEETEIFIKKDFDYGFELTHLYVHEEEREPVKVIVKVEDGTLYATSIEDV